MGINNVNNYTLKSFLKYDGEVIQVLLLLPTTHTHTQCKAHLQQQVMTINMQTNLTVVGETNLLRIEYLVWPLTEFRSHVFIHSNPLHPFGGLVVLPGHWDTGEQRKTFAACQRKQQTQEATFGLGGAVQHIDMEMFMLHWVVLTRKLHFHNCTGNTAILQE